MTNRRFIRLRNVEVEHDGDDVMIGVEAQPLTKEQNDFIMSTFPNTAPVVYGCFNKELILSTVITEF